MLITAHTKASMQKIFLNNLGIVPDDTCTGFLGVTQGKKEKGLNLLSRSAVVIGIFFS